ncbi:uncharacterized protein LOC116304714 [Actinia tenebrosa]|uniref:Uncharacterized protein LOC116304714 n=1 Tax=Actinia tenebrosa TaxID=6105 RepID=A0A6P8ITV1_ACTTE|nr:uncharacterized protein LOC116304714 [Actinia tenebrosa]
MGSGESKTETRYNYVDHTAERQEEERASEESRLRNERHQREIAEKRRIEKEKLEAADRARQEFLKTQQEEELAERQVKFEEERKEQEERIRQIDLEEQATSKRKGLFAYKFGEKTNLASFRGLDISDVKKLRIGVFGPTGSGKSCFINTCVRAVKQVDKGPVTIGTSGGEGTIILEDFLTDMFTNLVDTRGFFHYDAQEGGEFSDILYGRLKPGDVISRKGDEKEYNVANADTPFSDWLHGIILVVKANDPRLTKGELRTYLNPVRQILRPRGLSPVTVVTHRDTLRTQEDRNNALESASAATGSSRSHTFFVANYCPNNPGPNVETELEIFDILHFAILTAERYVKIAKQQKKNKEMDEIEKALGNADIGAPTDIKIVSTASIEVFLDILQRKYKWKEVTVKNVLKELREEDILTLKALADAWEEPSVPAKFPLGMRKMVESHLKSMDTYFE